jgi:hypothetical protein
MGGVGGDVHDVRFSRLLACVTEPPSAGDADFVRNLLHAYAACLTFDDLVDGTVEFLDGPASIRGALRNRLVRLASRSATPTQLEALAARLVALKPPNRLSRTTLDTLLSALYANLPATARRAVLDRWIDTGKPSDAARWLKALAEDDLHFDAQAILAYWRATRDWRAAKALAYRAEVELLTEILPELIRSVGEGWIISKAALRAGSLKVEDWEHIRGAFPASYLYLSAMLKHPVSPADAVRLVRASGGGFDGQRGLAIWALGEMDLADALDEIRGMESVFRADDLAKLGIELPDDA